MGCKKWLILAFCKNRPRITQEELREDVFTLWDGEVGKVPFGGGGEAAGRQGGAGFCPSGGGNFEGSGGGGKHTVRQNSFARQRRRKN